MDIRSCLNLKSIATTGLLVGLVFLNGCGSNPASQATSKATSGVRRYELLHDKAPHPEEKIPDLSKVPDAQPRIEPKSKLGNPKNYTVFKKNYTVMDSSRGYKERGIASWYGKKFHGYRTSNGEVYDMYSMSAAHKTLPLPTYAKVTNLKNGKSVIVKINDRGPFHADRVIDLSYAAASKLGILSTGTAHVEIEAIDLTTDLTELYLQVGAFSVEQNAKKLAAQIKQHAKGHSVNVRPSKNKNNKLFHVHIGPFQDETVVTQVKKKLAAQKFPTPIAVRLKRD